MRNKILAFNKCKKQVHLLCLSNNYARLVFGCLKKIWTPSFMCPKVVTDLKSTPYYPLLFYLHVLISYHSFFSFSYFLLFCKTFTSSSKDLLHDEWYDND